MAKSVGIVPKTTILWKREEEVDRHLLGALDHFNGRRRGKMLKRFASIGLFALQRGVVRVNEDGSIQLTLQESSSAQATSSPASQTSTSMQESDIPKGSIEDPAFEAGVDRFISSLGLDL